MNRRGFLHSLFASTATIVIAPACVLDNLPQIDETPRRTYFDMGRYNEDEIDRLLREVRPYIIMNTSFDLAWAANDHWTRRGFAR